MQTTKQRTAVFTDFCPDISIQQRLEMISEAGFEAVMLNFEENDSKPAILEQLKICAELGLGISCAHLPYGNSQSQYNTNDIWREESIFFNKIARDIALCGELEIPIAVMHLTYGSSFPKPNLIGIKRLERLLSLASECNVCLAFENKRNTRHMEELFINVKSPAAAICYDTGHEALYMRGLNEIERLCGYCPVAIIHLHDNRGKTDEHMLPFDGTIDMQAVAAQLRAVNYKGDILLEPRTTHSDFYKGVCARSFIKLAHQRAKRFCSLI